MINQKIKYFLIIIFITFISALYIFINHPKYKNNQYDRLFFVIEFSCNDPKQPNPFTIFHPLFKAILDSDNLESKIMISGDIVYSLEQLKGIRLENYHPLYALALPTNNDTENMKKNNDQLLNVVLDHLEEYTNFKKKNGNNGNCRSSILRSNAIN
jgi:hypothetical protein